MTDLKDLLDQAAGPDPLLTDDDLLADLRRGKRSVRRRQLAGMAAGATAVAVVAAGVWAVMPGGQNTGLDAPVAGQTSPTQSPATVGKPFEQQSIPPDRSKAPTGAPIPAKPVKLVPDGVVRAGTDLVCGLKPEGWTVTVYRSSGVSTSELILAAPGVDPAKSSFGSATLSVRHAKIWNENGQLLVEKYAQTWESLPHVRAGSRQAVATLSGQPNSVIDRDVHMRMGPTQLIQTHGGRAVHWDLPTLLRFTGSCGFAK